MTGLWLPSWWVTAVMSPCQYGGPPCIQCIKKTSCDVVANLASVISRSLPKQKK